MASLGLLLLGAALISAAQAIPAGRGQGRGFDVSVGGVSRHRRHVPDLLQYEDKRMFYPPAQTKGRANDLLYQSQAWGDGGLGQALQRLVERDQRREQEEDQKAAYLAALLRLLSSAEGAGVWDVEVLEDEVDNQDDVVPDYDETGKGLRFGRPPASWQGLMEPRLAEALLDRMDLQLFQSLLQRAGTTQEVPPRRSREQETLRRLVARILSTMGPQAPPEEASYSRRRRKRDLSLQAAEPLGSSDLAAAGPSIDPPLLRVKRLEGEDDEEKPLPYEAALQRIKRIDTSAEETSHGRHRRAALNYNPRILRDQILEYMRG